MTIERVRGEQSYRLVVRGERAVQLVDLIESIGIRTDGDPTVTIEMVLDQSRLRRVLDGITDLGSQLVALERLGQVTAPPAEPGDP